ncbi:SRPBCC family protein [Halomarina pelagica]|uniref:SRPBCC family protein n=1 Tax=Halomarina pelagica TaxID=2961599 RepID=UPI0020C24E3A|nr:SRPBCC family protein [Halomarina sp. BND7]
MVVFERETRVDAPFENVWRFHSRIQGLEALTPGFLNLEIERVVGPDDERNPEVLAAGTRVYASIRPFGVGPRRRWVSVIVEREAGEDAARFVDEMEGGPFPRWRHTHRFERDGDGTIVRDRVEYELPCGRLGAVAAAFGDLGFGPMFRYRHHRTRTLFE